MEHPTPALREIALRSQPISYMLHSRQKDAKPSLQQSPCKACPCCSGPRPALWSVMRAEHAKSHGLLLSLFSSKSLTQVLLRLPGSSERLPEP